ncbi:hypothetical protein [Pontibacter anaerobius]|uniref:MORN repeat variant n=1 Tax=Pontibacter anaerobius TaxID=2993940 RepID=A0ABT3RC43_9BACT|nr:hypothetical protein [Pontibacter anaerobius]MCX2739325.1 hypothetical protein [Pontibacter anaerobius]
MKLVYYAFLFLLLSLWPLAVNGQEKVFAEEKPKKHGFLFFRINRFDKEGKYHGRWKVYFGEDEQVIRNGRFRHGVEVGKWKYYYPDGTPYMLEKYNRRNNIILVEKFHENGNLARKGTARLIRTPTRDHYFWFGEWQVYDESGSFSHTETYKSGNLVSSTKGSKEVRD